MPEIRRIVKTCKVQLKDLSHEGLKTVLKNNVTVLNYQFGILTAVLTWFLAVRPWYPNLISDMYDVLKGNNRGDNLNRDILRDILY